MATVKVAVNPQVLRWAIERSGLPVDALAKAFPKLAEWQSGEGEPTLKQLEELAKRTMTPFGCFFLDAPPVETLPIPDFRTVGDAPIDRYSPDLMDTLHDMQRRQDWMREYLIDQGHERLPFVGSVKRTADPVAAAGRIRSTLGLAEGWAERCRTWEDAQRELRVASEEAGILVAVTGVVGLNNTRKLNPEEIRGFVLIDDFAPLIFVNGADAKVAQMFTLAHELAHIWLGKGRLFNLIRMQPATDENEKFCNHVAAEFLIPAERLAAEWPALKERSQPFAAIARLFKVSQLVAARRAMDLGFITQPQFFAFYKRHVEEWRQREQAKKDRRSRAETSTPTRTCDWDSDSPMPSCKPHERDGSFFGTLTVSPDSRAKHSSALPNSSPRGCRDEQRPPIPAGHERVCAGQEPVLRVRPLPGVLAGAACASRKQATRQHRSGQGRNHGEWR